MVYNHIFNRVFSAVSRPKQRSPRLPVYLEVNLEVADDKQRLHRIEMKLSVRDAEGLRQSLTEGLDAIRAQEREQPS